MMLGLTQADLAPLIGITAMQLHKYEKEANRIAAARLFRIAQVLGVDIGYFYEGANRAPAATSSPQRLLLQFIRAFGDIAAPRKRDALCSFARELATAELELNQRNRAA
jgi:transcriptional regulator with XRE-family HTH domain